MAVPRQKIPARVGDHASTVTKRNRLVFMLRLAPWFDDCSARAYKEVTRVDSCRKLGETGPKDDFVTIGKGWLLCTGCLKYRPAKIAMVHTSHFLDGAAEPGRWTRCLVRRQDEYLMHSHLVFHDTEDGWTPIVVDKRKLPGYVNPSAPKKKKKKSTTGSKAQAKSMKKEKIDTPVGGNGNGNDKATAGSAYQLDEPTGLEDCLYLPVDTYGTRVGEVSLCPRHNLDPVTLVGA
ncbi:uncharacterized protein HMPREF1541_03723 [Cyphellophora europaea CBS 101466]|uniref:Uncharacterized protein n=1 Tax=Cyphellophora europaea (strain CBS 101466) TaxID=1220924 RepID=W2RZ59_CYPE1|nr:uncharacterized protein HMPREF1541_03723 [Cyphellophora europaea CBS 101466]ETN41786.1 hypothetical protein HMPREF1541_03723 [Cyphellophora europaea CBS 101466]